MCLVSTFFHREFIQYDATLTIQNESYKCIVMDVYENDDFIIAARGQNIEIAIDALRNSRNKCSRD